MRLDAYLTSRGESQQSFAARVAQIVGRRVSQTTIGAVARGAQIPRSDLARAIIAASQQAPAPDGATVTLDDLAGRAA